MKSLILAPLVVCACAAPPSPLPAGGLPWSAPAIQDSVSVRDGRSRRRLAFDALLDRLAQADVVFLGETHDDETTHRVELAVLDGLLERRAGRVVLALEMFERDVQDRLDAYLAGRIDEAEFLRTARPWGNYRTAYRPLIELAKRSGIPVVASNFPRPLLRQLARKGKEVLNAAEPGHAPKQLFPNTPAYWRRTDNAVRSHRQMASGAAAKDPERLYTTQTLWDNAMGEACARALRAHPGHTVLHVNGGFHTAHWDGTVRQMALRAPSASVATVDIAPSARPQTAELAGKSSADFVVFAERRANDRRNGSFSVWVSRRLRYRLHVPKGEGPWPLLIWLPEDGLNAADGVALWRRRFGDKVAIASLEAPYIETADDLAEGGRWFRADSFYDDVGMLRGVIEDVWAHVVRHHAIDVYRVCLAGVGTGATVVGATALWSDRLGAHAVAIAPRRYRKIADLSLPLPELRDARDKARPSSLTVVANEASLSWWQGECAAHAEVGLDSRVRACASDAWLDELDRENAVRVALSLPSRPAGDKRRHVVATSVRSRHWGRLLAAQHQAAGALVAVLDTEPVTDDSEPIPTDPDPSKMGSRLPRCPGAFGGTTVVVLPDSASSAEVEAWASLEREDPIHKGSPFHRLRIADAKRPLASVLEKLHGENRKNVLIVPALFCADGTTMRALRKVVRGFEDRMTLRWRPGLGGLGS